MGEYRYKYMSLNNIKRLFEIIYNHRIYAPNIDELNDIKEGSVRCSPSVKRRELMKKLMERTYIVSTTDKGEPFDGHMFAIYGNCHRGCCLKFTVTSKLHTDKNGKMPWIEGRVKYVNEIPKVEKEDSNTIAGILTSKSTQWEDESEVRYIKTIESGNGKKRKRPYLYINLAGIYFGKKVSKEDVKIYTAFIEAFAKSKNKQIEVRQLTNKDIDFGFDAKETVIR